MERLSIYISSPDSYSDVFEVYLKCFNKYWCNCPYKLYLSTNKNSYEGINVINHDVENDDWVSRTIYSLPYINSKYILLMCDDLFIIDEPDNSAIEIILDYMDEHNINYCNFSKKICGKRISNYVNKVSRKQAYAKNLQIGIFNKDYLYNYLVSCNMNAWQIEGEWLKESFLATKGFYDDVIWVRKIFINYSHGVIKGKWLPSSIKTLEKRNILINSSREKMSSFAEKKLFLKRKLGKRISPKFRYYTKRFLKKIGFKFQSDY